MTITSARNDACDEAAKEAQRHAHFNPTILTLPNTEIAMLKKKLSINVCERPCSVKESRPKKQVSKIKITHHTNKRNPKDTGYLIQMERFTCDISFILAG